MEPASSLKAPLRGWELATRQSGGVGRWVRIAAATALTTVLVAALAASGGGPAGAQGVSGIRIQSQNITGAIGRQIQQSMRPHLQVRNSAGPISDCIWLETTVLSSALWSSSRLLSLALKSP